MAARIGPIEQTLLYPFEESVSHSFGTRGIVPTDLTDTAWAYWRPGVCDIVELALVQGVDVGLPDHFHDEDQVTFVIRGQRRFVMARQSVFLGPGEGTCIPAGMPHRSLPQPLGVLCINVYLQRGAYDTSALLDQMAEAWRLGMSPMEALSDLARARRSGLFDASCTDIRVASGVAGTVHTAAKAFGMSREGYSRAFRRTHGMPPQAFSMVSRLNDARRLLRGNAPPAETAAMTGFADQSHLGRCFRRAFGVTPGRYRTG